MVIAIALPIMIQNAITQFVGLLDNIMVGNVGTDQMTGVAIANQVIFIFNLAVFGAVTGAGIFGAQFYGKGDHEGVRFAFRFKIIASVIITLAAIGAFVGFGDEIIMSYLKGEGNVENIEAALAYGKEYLLIMLLGFLPYAIMSCYAGTLRESKETLLPMKAGVIAVLTNLCLNAVLIFGLFGLPAMGSAGAAWATVISRFVEFFIVVIWTHKNHEKHPFIKGAFRSLYIPFRTALDILKKAFPLIVNESLWALGVALLNQCYSTRGYDVVAAVNISNTIANLFCVSFMSLGTAVGIIVGQQLGAGESEKAVDSARKMMAFSVATSIVFGALLAISAPFFPLLYKTEASIRALSTLMIFMRVGHMPIYAIAHSCYFTIRAGGRTFITVLFDSVYAIGIVYPIALVLATFTNISILPLYFITQYVEIGKAAFGIILVSNRRVWVRNLVEEK
jgi:putative MATE family efflux protein